MREICTAHVSLLDDRGVTKLRINFIKGDRIYGCIKPVSPFKERRQPPGGIPSFEI